MTTAYDATFADAATAKASSAGITAAFNGCLTDVPASVQSLGTASR